ncbi:MAG TPA: hypothetical protein VGJ81_21605 [Thermoanaerobaculia bacterium]|jgi:hypothetical protein
MLGSEVIERIRPIFLHQRPRVSLTRAAALLGWTRGEISKAIRAGEVEVTKASMGEWICREELQDRALESWPLEAIEEALGADADRALPPAWRLADLHVRVPRYHVDMLEYMAGRERTTVSDILTRELEDMASANAEEFSRSLAGFHGAMRWPSAGARD